MKSLLTSLLALLIMTLDSSGAISIYSADYTWRADDTLIYYRPSNQPPMDSLYENMPVGPNTTWQFSSVRYNTPSHILVTFNNLNSQAFPTADASVGTDYYFYNYPVACQEFYQKNSSGHYFQGFTLDTMFYPFDDKWETYFIIPKQKVLFEPVNEICKFPMEYRAGGEDYITSSRGIKAIINIPQMNLNKANLEMKQTSTQITKSIGYGKMNVEFLPPNIDVLQYSVMQITDNMLYIDGTPAPRALADSLGLASERSDTLYSYCFYAKGYPGEILRVNKIRGPEDFYYWSSVLKEPAPTYVEESLNKADLSVSPQPSYNGIIDIKFNKTSELPYSISVYDAMGNKVATSITNNNIGEINHRTDLSNQSAGAYFIKVQSNNGDMIYNSKALIIK